MDYQTKIELAHEMAKDQAVKDALEDGELLGLKEDEWEKMSPKEIIADIKSWL